MVDTTDSKSVGFGHASSSLAAPISGSEILKIKPKPKTQPQTCICISHPLPNNQ